jgi:flagellar motor switch protein FliG
VRAAAARRESELNKLGGAEKGLLFLVSLEEAVATKILKCMTPEEVRQLRAAANNLPEVVPAALTAVHVEFAQAMERGTTSLKGSGAYLRRLVGQALGEAKAVELWTDTREGTGAVQALAELDIPTILGIIDREHPQTLAVILSQIESKRAAEISAKLSPEKQAQVLLRMAQLEGIPHHVIEEIEKQFATEIASLSSGSRQEIDGVKIAGNLLKFLDSERSEAILEELSSLDAALVTELKKALFTFEDLQRIDSRGLQALLKEVSTENLVLALKTASEVIREKVFSSVSSRASQMLREELELLGPTRLADVESAQQAIVEAALRLEREGKIQIAREGGSDYV